jgi:hypothetical protein
VGARELVGRGADIHTRVVENEIIQVDEGAVEPQTGAGVGEVRPRAPAVADWTLGQPLVEPRERIFGGGQRAGELAPRQWIEHSVYVWQEIRCRRSPAYGR